MTEKIYSTQRVKNLGSRKIQNPVHFTAPEEGVKKVYVQDGYPHINDAYERLGVTVEPLDKLSGQSAASAAPAEKKDK